MNKGILTITNTINEIYNIYESHIWKNNECKLYISIEKFSINMSITQDKEVIDESIFVFNEKEKKIFKYATLSLFNNALGYVIIHKNENIFTNPIHRPYLTFTINDNEILNIINELVDNQYKAYIHEGLNKLFSNLPSSHLKKDALLLNNKIELTKSHLRSLRK